MGESSLLWLRVAAGLYSFGLIDAIVTLLRQRESLFRVALAAFSLGAVFPGEASSTSSFPSGHTALAFAVVTPYAELYHQPWLYAIPVAVGLGRIVAVDGPWASDVVGGGFVGWLTADLTRRFFPDSDYGLILFGDGQHMQVGITGRF